MHHDLAQTAITNLQLLAATKVSYAVAILYLGVVWLMAIALHRSIR
jgi:hypothetical protein